jgi:hypothetical protein
MNYIEQINGFWSKAASDNLTGSDISVYFSLLHYCNKLSWINPFICHWDIVCQYSKVSKNTFYKSMDNLTKMGYIKFEMGEKNKKKPKVFILKFENRKGTAVGTEKEQKGNSKGTAVGTEKEQKGNIYKHINPLNIENLKTPQTNKNEEGGGENNFVGENFKYDFSKIKWSMWNVQDGGFPRSILQTVGQGCKVNLFEDLIKAKRDEGFVANDPKAYWMPKLIQHLKDVDKW